MTTANRTQIKVKDLVITALLTSLVLVATMFINIRLPISINGGLIHMGNVMLFLSALLFGKRKAAIAGAFGMGLFDLLMGWVPWAPFTFLIRGTMGYLVGTIAYSNGKNGSNLLYNLFAIACAGLVLIPGYYMTEVILYGNWTTPLTSIPGNIVQVVFGSLAIFIAPVLRKALQLEGGH